MTVKLLIEALERIADMRTAGGDLIEMHRYELRGIAKTALAAYRSQQEAAPEPHFKVTVHKGLRPLPTRATSNPHKGGTQAYLATEYWNEGWNACLDEIGASPAPSESEAKALAVIDAARTAMDESFEAGNDAQDISIPSHFAAALSLCLDEYDAALSASGQKGEPT